MGLIKYMITTEKAIGLMEFQNKLIFVVDKNATKPEIKKEIETTFNVKVASVKVHNTMKGQKRAYVKLEPKYRADEIAAKLKVA